MRVEIRAQVREWKHQSDRIQHGINTVAFVGMSIVAYILFHIKEDSKQITERFDMSDSDALQVYIELRVHSAAFSHQIGAVDAYYNNRLGDFSSLSIVIGTYRFHRGYQPHTTFRLGEIQWSPTVEYIETGSLGLETSSGLCSCSQWRGYSSVISNKRQRAESASSRTTVQKAWGNLVSMRQMTRRTMAHTL
jgi:hypothetical protein